MSHAEFNDLYRLFTRQWSFEPGATLVEQGEAVEQFFLVVDGAVTVSTAEGVSHAHHRGFVFGSASGEPAPATVVASSACVCAVLSAGDGAPIPAASAEAVARLRAACAPITSTMSLDGLEH
eukprot:4896936-Prymnesium_polylepis.1